MRSQVRVLLWPPDKPEEVDTTPIRPKELDRIISDAVAFGNEEEQENIRDLLDELNKHYDTKSIIAEHEMFFSRLQDVEEVICLGLSFGDVDIPYLERIVQEIKPTTKWVVYYYSKEDHKRLKDVFGILGIKASYEVYFLPSSHFWDK